MTNIVSAKLSFSHNHSANTVHVVVTGKISFTNLERFLMKQGLWFRLGCKLWGDDGDHWWNRDDYLYTFGSKRYPDSTPSATESFKFSVTLGESVLNEDWGRDEVYAFLKLRNMYTNQTVKRKSNVIKHHF